METKYYYKNDCGTNIYLTEHGLKHSYFLSGYQNPKFAGYLYTVYFGNGGTTLAPVFKDGKHIINIEFAGKNVYETNFINNKKITI